VRDEPQLQTERLLLRRWRFTDIDPLTAMNADPAVMEYFPATLSAHETAAFVERVEQSFEENNFGLWAVEIPGEESFVGFVGLWTVELDVPFAPAVEVGWRLAREFWGQGIATEAAAAAMSFGFDELDLTEVVSFTAAANMRSRRVMARLGMLRDSSDDFMHPLLDADHSLAPHVLYRMDVRRWRAEEDEA
jgi:RimJ/RimL family protein N-acetyltransferase